MADDQNNVNNEAMQQVMRLLGIGGGLGTAAGGAFGLFSKNKNPATGAMNTIGQIPGQTNQYYQPYMDAGKGALEDLQNQYKGLLGGTKQNELGANYKESPGYQFALKQALAASNNANAAGGMLGTPMNQQNNMETAQGLAAKDYNDYMQNQMGLYGSGLHGEEGLNTQGQTANSNYADVLGNALSQQAGYQYAGQAGQNAHKSNMLGNIFSGLGTAGGAFLGGPGGAAAGKGAMDWLTNFFGKGNQ